MQPVRNRDYFVVRAGFFLYISGKVDAVDCS